MPGIDKKILFNSLPDCWSGGVFPRSDTLHGSKLVVLDDDPTGTQTVKDVPVLTVWNVDALTREFDRPNPCFFILTNSRSMPAGQAAELNTVIARNLKKAAGGRPFQVVSRSDSTLRGHFPLETDILSAELGPFDGIILMPYFENGGRYTIHDVHYVQEGDELIPAAETPFARDAAFGYTRSNIADYVEEKTGGSIKREELLSISINDIRIGGPNTVANKLSTMSHSQVAVVNCAHLQDARVFVSGLKAALMAGKRFLFRTAADFVSSYLGIESAKFNPSVTDSAYGGLVVVGSYIAKSSAQLQVLLQSADVIPLELDVEKLLKSRQETIQTAQHALSAIIMDGKDAVLFTSRKLITGSDGEQSLDIGKQVSSAVVEIIRGLRTRPRYLISKGGITSSDIAAKGLGIRRTTILGALIPGVPVWECPPDSKFPGLPLVVFPGNVGDEFALARTLALMRG